jgi:hypothetical protein
MPTGDRTNVDIATAQRLALSHIMEGIHVFFEQDKDAARQLGKCKRRDPVHYLVIDNQKTDLHRVVWAFKTAPRPHERKTKSRQPCAPVSLHLSSFLQHMSHDTSDSHPETSAE